jgi:hypothetical protein
MDLLAEWIGSAPDPETIDEFANKHPDKYITALSSLARIAGFTEKTETSVDITVNYRSLSDSQLEDRMAQLQRELGMHTKVINHQPADAERDELLSSKSDAAEDPS